ncbi:hypothetical protein LMG24238_06704 [Paraburkholderia sediminicola]|uniref:Ferredoxin n=1 Tax=Paraburkholderia sediminicola TaxID=458836 RepID=A0A6J5CNI0_9BURK|nr:ferredoxin [Paraburkholderia sediminicola]CAB3741012.1 hypothetical protein LMG24238_06704 [Paraburkholderia sediminicola]
MKIAQEGIVKIIVDRSRCTGIGLCESIAEDYFEVGDDGVLTLIRGESVPPEEFERIREAVQSCPARALSLKVEQ